MQRPSRYYRAVIDVSVDLPSINNTSFAKVDLTVAGAPVAPIVAVHTPGLAEGMFIADARVATAGEINLLVYNLSGGTVDAAALTFTFYFE